MMREHAPAYRGGLPLGTPGDDGSGIRLGVWAGGATAFLGRVSVWRFLSPPSALLSGVLVGRDGRRVCDESRYGAAVGAAMMAGHGGQAWLLADRATLARARRQLRGPDAVVPAAAGVCTCSPPRGSARPRSRRWRPAPGSTRAAWRRPWTPTTRPRPPGAPTRRASRPSLVRPQDQPPFSLIDCSVRPRLAYPAPMLTLGGLVVAEDTGQVRRADGTVVPGLYAAGRTAVGLCSHSYVSGLSLADCVFSGRRAGRSAAAANPAGQRLL